MVRHVVLIRWIEGCPSASVDQVEATLREVAAAVPTVRGYRLARDLNLREGNADFLIEADFEDTAGYLTYASDPAHLRAVTEVLNPLVLERRSLQVELPD